MITAFFVVDFGLSTEVDKVFRSTEDNINFRGLSLPQSP